MRAVWVPPPSPTQKGFVNEILPGRCYETQCPSLGPAQASEGSPAVSRAKPRPSGVSGDFLGRGTQGSGRLR